MKEKKPLFVFISVLVIAFIFSLAALCNMCGINPGGRDFDTIPEEVISAQAREDADKKGQKTDTEDLNPNTSELLMSDEEESVQSQNDIETANGDTKQNYTGNEQENISPGARKIILKDNRLVISLDSMAGRSTEWSYQNGNDPNIYETRDYFTKIGIPEEQLLFFWGQDSLGGTFDNFKLAVDTLKISTDKNCIIYVFLMSHGNEGNPETGLEAGMEFANGEGNEHWGTLKTYSEIGSMLNEIRCDKMVVITHSCALAGSVFPITEDTSYPRISLAPITIQEILNYIMTDGSSVDMNMDGMISILDVYNFVKDPGMTLNPARYEGIELNDYFGIASNIFLN